VTAAITHAIARYQTHLALVCVLALAVDAAGLYALPGTAVAILVAIAAAVGVKRPSEVALRIAAEVGPHPRARSVTVASLLALVLGALALEYPDPAPESAEIPQSPDTTGGESSSSSGGST